jgi:hypothetical protein
LRIANRALPLAALLASAAVAPAQSIVYQNMSGLNLLYGAMSSGFGGSFEFGDQVQLAGTDRRISEMQTRFRTFADTSGQLFNYDLTLRFRSLDFGTPGAILFERTVAVRNQAGNSGGFVFTASNIDTLVPNEFVVTMQLVRMGGNSGTVGVDFGPSATIGSSSPAFYWENIGGWQQSDFPVTGRANMALQLSAVPEPASFAVIALGSIVLLRRRRRR